jgi:hypothetical protein
MKNSTIKQSLDYQLIAMSFHESGHTITALHNYLQVQNVNVMTEKNREGNTEYFVYGDIIEDKELKKILLIFELQVLYAGLLAEKIYYKDICGSSKFPMHLRKGSWYDTALASSIIRKNSLAMPGKKTFLFKKEIQYDVNQVLLEHWDAVRQVAHSLYQRKKLSFDEIKYILIHKTEHKEFWQDRFRKIKLIHNENKPLTEEIAKDLMLEDNIFNI